MLLWQTDIPIDRYISTINSIDVEMLFVLLLSVLRNVHHPVSWHCYQSSDYRWITIKCYGELLSHFVLFGLLLLCVTDHLPSAIEGHSIFYLHRSYVNNFFYKMLKIIKPVTTDAENDLMMNVQKMSVIVLKLAKLLRINLCHSRKVGH